MIPHCSIDEMTGSRVLPNSVNEYVVFTGTDGKTSLEMTPSANNSLS